MLQLKTHARFFFHNSKVLFLFSFLTAQYDCEWKQKKNQQNKYNAKYHPDH